MAIKGKIRKHINTIVHVSSRGDLSVGITPGNATIEFDYHISESEKEEIRLALETAFAMIWDEGGITVLYDEEQRELEETIKEYESHEFRDTIVPFRDERV